jgi:hypothetical protein
MSSQTRNNAVLEESADQIDEEFYCAICQGILNKSNQCKQGHNFCESCIFEWLDRQQVCPICRIPLTKDDLSKNRILDNVIGRLPVKCPHGESKSNPNSKSTKKTRSMVKEDESLYCEWNGIRSELKNHLLNVCEFQTILCPMHGCDKSVQRKELAAHLENCEYRKLPCAYCNTLFEFINLPDHEKIHCLLRPIDCSCGVYYVFRETVAHKLTCSKELIQCPFHVHGCQTRMISRDKFTNHQTAHATQHAELIAAGLAKVNMSVCEVLWKINLAELHALPVSHCMNSKPIVMKVPRGGKYLEDNSYEIRLSATKNEDSASAKHFGLNLLSTGDTYPLGLKGTSITVGDTIFFFNRDNIQYNFPSENKRFGWAKVYYKKKDIVDECLTVTGTIKISLKDNQGPVIL